MTMSNKTNRKPLLSDDDLYAIVLDAYKNGRDPYELSGAIRKHYEDLITKGELILKSAAKKPCGPCEEKRKKLQARQKPSNNE